MFNTGLPRVLVIDPEPGVREGVAQVLGRQGCRVTQAECGKDALHIIRRGGFHLALLELHLPDMEGIEALMRLKEAAPDLDVIIVTGRGTIEKAVNAIREGAVDVITKPFVPWLLKQAVGRAFELRKLAEERDRLAAERDRGLWAITKEKSRLKAVINSMSEGVMINDQDGGIVLCNPAFTRLMSLEETCIIGTKVSSHPGLAPLAKLASHMSEGEDETLAVSQEIAIQDNPPVYIRASINRVLGDDGATLGMVTVLEDITLFKQMDRKKSDFVAMVSHELKAPLAVIDTQVNVILRSLGKDLGPKQLKMLNRMQERVWGAMEMINDLLDLTRIEDQGVVREKVPVGINHLAGEVCDLLSDQASEKGHTLFVDLADGLPEILADPGSIKEVVVNLVGNAIRYTPRGGLIEVRTGTEGGYVLLMVSDSGIGIAQEDQERIFERFFRVKSDKTRDIVGTGLGLPIVKAIVEDHRGSIRLNSQPNKGSVFEVLLPAMV